MKRVIKTSGENDPRQEEAWKKHGVATDGNLRTYQRINIVDKSLTICLETSREIGQFPRKTSITKINETKKTEYTTEEGNQVNNLWVSPGPFPSLENKPETAKITKSSKNR